MYLWSNYLSRLHNTVLRVRKKFIAWVLERMVQILISRQVKNYVDQELRTDGKASSLSQLSGSYLIICPVWSFPVAFSTLWRFSDHMVSLHFLYTNILKQMYTRKSRFMSDFIGRLHFGSELVTAGSFVPIISCYRRPVVVAISFPGGYFRCLLYLWVCTFC